MRKTGRNDINIPPFGIGLGFLLLLLLSWSYWPTIYPLFKEWQENDNYSIGQLVPLAALWMVWHDRKELSRCRLVPCWWGIGLVLAAQALRAYGLLFLYESAERYSLVLTVAGLVLLCLGTQAFRQLRWILLFLFLMIPLPGRIHNIISDPLQTQATNGAVFCLELMGVEVTQYGNVLTLAGGKELAVAEACSGLRMLTAFVVVAAVLAYIVRRPGWQKITLVLSSIPIAILCNIIRLVCTAELYRVTNSDIAGRFFHDFAGLVMMPLAIFFLVGELFLIKKLFIPENPPQTDKPAG